MAKKISFKLSASSIQKAIKELRRYELWIEQKTKQLIEALAEIGVYEASVRFAAAQYDGINDSDISAEETETGWKIIASGRAVCFIEFGAGVYHNSGEPYPLPRPEGVVKIGEYGKGSGKRQGWVYRGDPGASGRYISDDTNLVFTRGNPAAMPMYYASEEIKNRVAQIAREVFST